MVDGPVDQLDHGASQALWGGKMAIDGTKKWPEEGYKRDWPEVCTQDGAIKARVDAMWSELGIPLRPAAERTAGGSRSRVEPDLARRAASPEEHAGANREMFDRIAPTYDRLNRVMSLGIDRRWRTRALEMMGPAIEAAPEPRVLDLCAGTLDLAALLEETFPKAHVVACDASEKMLALGRAKVHHVECVVGDALALPFEDSSFDAVVCGFGVRNLADLRKGLREVRRVLKPRGSFVTLELFRPRSAASRFVHGAGLRYALPVLGAALAKDREAYEYLAESMEGFVTREAYEHLLEEEGFGPVDGVDLTLGMASIVRAQAPRSVREEAAQ
jgi:ubiquinone/menaquinone biosynthesis methyltransferase